MDTSPRTEANQAPAAVPPAAPLFRGLAEGKGLSVLIYHPDQHATALPIRPQQALATTLELPTRKSYVWEIPPGTTTLMLTIEADEASSPTADGWVAFIASPTAVRFKLEA